MNSLGGGAPLGVFGANSTREINGRSNFDNGNGSLANFMG